MKIEIGLRQRGCDAYRTWHYECPDFRAVKSTCNRFIDIWITARCNHTHGDNVDWIDEAHKDRPIDFILVSDGDQEIFVIEVKSLELRK